MKITMACNVALLLLLSIGAESLTLPPITGYKITDAKSVKMVRQFGDSALFELNLPEDAEFSLGKVMVANLTGDRFTLGQAYATLLGKESIETYNSLLNALFGDNIVAKDALMAFCDWIWNNHYSKYVPKDYLIELEGMKKASPAGQPLTIDQVSKRFNTLGNMPADPQNIITAIEFELDKGLPKWEARLLNDVINHLTNCTWCIKTERGLRVPFAPGCDAFGVWGTRTQDGKLLSSRNLDWNADTGISKHKLVTITHAPNSHPYAAFGFASGFGAIAGMNERGVTTSEMNLDNALTTFDGPPFPLRFRMILEQTHDLRSAKALWQATNNTDSMNYLIGSAKDNKAMAIEAMRGYSGFFHDNDPVEAAATCVVSDDQSAGTCGSGFADKETHDGHKKIGSPLEQVVWRTNHAVDPKHTLSQEPLFNDTSFRYELLHDLFKEYETQGVKIGDKEAIAIAASLGIKGPNFLTCEKQDGADNVLSAIYKPRVGAGSAYVAWEDGSGSTYTPAACTTYVHFDFSQWWGKSEPTEIVV